MISIKGISESTQLDLQELLRAVALAFDEVEGVAGLGQVEALERVVREDDFDEVLRHHEHRDGLAGRLNDRGDEVEIADVLDQAVDLLFRELLYLLVY